MAAFVLGWFMRDEHTAMPELLAGTVIWSNDETRRIVVELGGREEGTREFAVAAQQWTDAQGRSHNRGYPSCLAGHPGDPVRTDRRAVELGVVRLDLDDSQPEPLVVTVRCNG
ncbi:hypothetical protein [Krasilnikovia cinnamomea]|uniref:hypothetical protein n=1 Tax=Krasilnikovia cinnamomea TaxID=349313 RepID=UPI00102D0BBE|nr:hypothetical protein [Krasilnikovia cinnamomea]